MHYRVHIELGSGQTLKRCKRLFESMWSAQSYAERLLCDSSISTVRVSSLEGDGAIWQRSRILPWHRLSARELHEAHGRVSSWPWLSRQS